MTTRKTEPGINPTGQDKSFLDTIIIGTGFAGICMGIKLKQAGIHSFKIFEQEEAIGGTWRDNTYPGAECDVQSHLYSYSFEPNPHWKKMFGEQSEILAYMNFCVDKYDLRHKISFNTYTQQTNTTKNILNQYTAAYSKLTTIADRHTSNTHTLIKT
jgi:cation diffusion facilitator CzcD-associated flavoprotein CzcO